MVVGGIALRVSKDAMSSGSLRLKHSTAEQFFGIGALHCDTQDYPGLRAAALLQPRQQRLPTPIQLRLVAPSGSPGQNPDPPQQPPPSLHCDLCGLGAWLRGQGAVPGVHWVQLWRGAGGALRLRLCDGKPTGLPGDEAGAAAEQQQHSAIRLTHSAAYAYVAGSAGLCLAARQVVAAGGQIAEAVPAAAAEAAGQVVGSAAQAVADAVAPWLPSSHAMACSAFQRRALGDAAAAAGGICRRQSLGAELEAVAAGREPSAATGFASASDGKLLWDEASGRRDPQSAADECGVARPVLGTPGQTGGAFSVSHGAQMTAETRLERQGRQEQQEQHLQRQQQQEQQQEAESSDALPGKACGPGSLVGWMNTKSVVLPRDRARTFWAPEFMQQTPAGEVQPSVTVTLHVDFGTAGARNGSDPGAGGGGQGVLCSGHTVVEARVLAVSGRTASWHLVGVVPLLKARGAKHGEQVVIRRLADGRLTLRVGGGTHAAVLESQRRVEQSDVPSAGQDRKRRAEVQQEAVPPLRKRWRRLREGCPAQGHMVDCAAGPSGAHEPQQPLRPLPQPQQQEQQQQQQEARCQVRTCPSGGGLVGCVWRA